MEGSEVDGVVGGVVDGAVGVVAGSVEGAVDGVVGTVVGSVGSSTRATTLFTVLYRELATKSLEISTPVALSYLLLYGLDQIAGGAFLDHVSVLVALRVVGLEVLVLRSGL